jgi:dihydrofolate reductase
MSSTKSRQLTAFMQVSLDGYSYGDMSFAHKPPEEREWEKVVFSRTLTSAEWPNTTVVNHDLVGTIRAMKGHSGPDMAILGSGSIVTQLAEAGLVDTIQVVVNPVALGAGKAFLAGLNDPLRLALTQTRPFANGSLVLWYAPGSSALSHCHRRLLQRQLCFEALSIA